MDNMDNDQTDEAPPALDRNGELPLNNGQLVAAAAVGLIATVATGTNEKTQTIRLLGRKLLEWATWTGGIALGIWVYDEAKHHIQQRRSNQAAASCPNTPPLEDATSPEIITPDDSPEVWVRRVQIEGRRDEPLLTKS